MDKNSNNLFLATIWTSNLKNLDKICKIISKQNKILEVRKCFFDIDWGAMIRIIYQDDKVSVKSLKRKTKHLSSYPKVVIFIFIEVKDPIYRYKGNKRKLSTVMEKLKKTIRDKYGSKMSALNPIHIVDEASHSHNLLKKLEIMEANNEIRFE